MNRLPCCLPGIYAGAYRHGTSCPEHSGEVLTAEERTMLRHPAGKDVGAEVGRGEKGSETVSGLPAGDGGFPDGGQLSSPRRASAPTSLSARIWQHHGFGCACPACAYTNAHLDDADDARGAM